MEGKPPDHNNLMTSRPRGSHTIILYLPAFVNSACHQIWLTINMTSKPARLRETHTHAHFLSTLILILSNGHYWTRTSDLHDVNVTL